MTIGPRIGGGAPVRTRSRPRSPTGSGCWHGPVAEVADNMIGDVVGKWDNHNDRWPSRGGIRERLHAADGRSQVSPRQARTGLGSGAVMPFDSTTFCQPTVTVLSPQPPERGGGPQRIQLLIEIVQRPQPAQRRGSGPHGEQRLCRSWQQGWQTFHRVRSVTLMGQHISRPEHATPCALPAASAMSLTSTRLPA